MADARDIAAKNAEHARAVAAMEMRADFPDTATIVDEFRAAGLPVKVRHAEEGDKQVGKHMSTGGAPYSGTGYEMVSATWLRRNERWTDLRAQKRMTGVETKKKPHSR